MGSILSNLRDLSFCDPYGPCFSQGTLVLKTKTEYFFVIQASKLYLSIAKSGSYSLKYFPTYCDAYFWFGIG